MKRVYAFTDKDLERIKEFFKLKNKIVMYHMVFIGTNVALRISDLTSLKFEDIENYKYNKLIANVTEKKTKKKRIVVFNEVCKKSLAELKKYYKSLGYNSEKGYIFKSLDRKYRKGLKDIPISTAGVNKHLQYAKEYLDIQYPIGSHSFRKTWGNRAYEKYKKIGIVSMALGHSSEKVTMKYLGIEEEDIMELFEELTI